MVEKYPVIALIGAYSFSKVNEIRLRRKEIVRKTDELSARQESSYKTLRIKEAADAARGKGEVGEGFVVKST